MPWRITVPLPDKGRIVQCAAVLRLFTGTSGFAYKEWKGSFYPADLPDAKMLAFYAEHFGSVEINNTFYRMPNEKVLLDWAERVPADFKFVLKASRQITHIKRLKETQPVAYFLEKSTVLGARRGPLLFQLPPNMKKDLERLQAFLPLVPAGRARGVRVPPSELVQ